ncbi:unnamed protein product [Leptosia nina]|uniref:Uncharacterized protein n=1 Tax=Leptosia nina TaxID=320188 RepID=A0AAV1JDC4_9NEOP
MCAGTRAAATQSRSRACDCARVGCRTALQPNVMSSRLRPPLLLYYARFRKAADAERSIFKVCIEDLGQ